jgi:hypothetical protein
MTCDFIQANPELRAEVKAVQTICRSFGTARALMVDLLISNGEWDQLADLSIDAADYEDPEHFAQDYLVSSLLRKSPNLPLKVDVEQVAIDSFYEAETRCRITNERLSGVKPAWFATFQKEVNNLIGPLRRQELDYIEHHMAFGPGATTSKRGEGSVPPDKYSGEIHLTEELYPFYKAVLGSRWWETASSPRIVEGNKFATVPKDARTRRGICIEPDLNVYVQKGVGAQLRRRLKRFGVDLDDQGWNQYLAAMAEAFGLSTIDLRQASDSMAWRLVFEAVTNLGWFELLDLCRSKVTRIKHRDGTVVSLTLEKFSSMGNGFTFELESLLFAALVRTFVPKKHRSQTAVYGDDIIVPRQYANDVIEALDFLGFEVNRRKSFLAGSFFESCGTDWFLGHSVRPFFLKGQQESEGIPYTVQIANAFRLWTSRVGKTWKGLSEGTCDASYRETWIELLKHAPQSWRALPVPLQMGDSGILKSLAEATSSAKSKVTSIGWEFEHGYHTSFAVLRPKEINIRGFNVLLYKLAQLHRSTPSERRSLCVADEPQFAKNTFAARGLFGSVVIKRAPVYWDPVSLAWV